MKVIFLGPPGCGKGTYASRICEKNGWSHISTGDLLRSGREDPEHGETIKKFQDTGGLVPDDIVLAVLKKDWKNQMLKKDSYSTDSQGQYPRQMHLKTYLR